MMDPINPLDQMTELLRKRIATEVSVKSTSVNKGKSTSVSDKAILGRISTGELNTKIVTQIKQIEPNDAQRNQKMMHIFLENVLIWQFGDELLNDSDFSRLVSEVKEALEKVPITTQLFDQIFLKNT